MLVRRWPAYSAIASFFVVALACLIGLGWNLTAPSVETTRTQRSGAGSDVPQVSIPDPVERDAATQGS
jgi:hypothetical protein